MGKILPIALYHQYFNLSTKATMLVFCTECSET